LRGNLSELVDAVKHDIALNNLNLEKIVASADGLQVSSDGLCTAHHFANVMFNAMRGGVFADGYNIRAGFIDFVSGNAVFSAKIAFFSELPSS
jgi:hypothetical protein